MKQTRRDNAIGKYKSAKTSTLVFWHSVCVYAGIALFFYSLTNFEGAFDTPISIYTGVRILVIVMGIFAMSVAGVICGSVSARLEQSRRAS